MTWWHGGRYPQSGILAPRAEREHRRVVMSRFGYPEGR